MSKRTSPNSNSSISAAAALLVRSPRSDTMQLLRISKRNLLRMKLVIWLYGSERFSLSFAASCFRTVVASVPVPPLQLNTSGEKEPMSTSCILTLYSLFFDFPWWTYICSISLFQLLGASGLKTLTSKNALQSGFQKLRALMSDLAPSDTLVPGGKTSPVTGRRGGSSFTSLHTSINSSPFLQVRQWFIEYSTPHIHFFGTSFSQRL